MDEMVKNFLSELIAMVSKAMGDRQEATQSEKIDLLTKALVKVQMELEGVNKDSPGQVGNQKYEYADLHACFEASRPLLTKNGFAVSQVTKVVGGKNHIITKLLHESGQWLQGSLLIEPAVKTPQGEGAALTYGRRYSYTAMVGLTQKDDDGASASHSAKKQNGQPSQQSRPAPPPVPGAAKTATEAKAQIPNHAPGNQPAGETKPLERRNAKAGGKVISEPQQKRLFAIIKQSAEWRLEDVKYVLKTSMDLDKSEDMNKEQYDWLVDLIQKTNPADVYK